MTRSNLTRQKVFELVRHASAPAKDLADQLSRDLQLPIKTIG